MRQIRGIVKAAQRVQNSLKLGISPHDAAAFKQFVTGSVETIERLCEREKIAPDRLPTRSRTAYYYLKQIDLDNLPLAESREVSPVEQTIRLKNIKTQQRAILEKISRLAATPTTKAAQFQELALTLVRAVTAIEKICSSSQATPANLTSSSRPIYAWMKFLTDERNLQLHLQTTYQLRQIAWEILHARGQKCEKLVIELTNQAGLYKSRRSEGVFTIIISEGFINASEAVLKALVTDALLGKSQHNRQLIRDFANSEEYSDVLWQLDASTEAIAEQAPGECYNLNELFDKVNRQYFASTLVKPRLAWSQINTYRKFGHYDPSRDRVVISLTLDDARIPEFVVEFVLYHELLHKHYGATWVNGKRMVHTSEFRHAERKFARYQEAQECLRKLAACSDRVNF